MNWNMALCVGSALLGLVAAPASAAPPAPAPIKILPPKVPDQPGIRSPVTPEAMIVLRQLLSACTGGALGTQNAMDLAKLFGQRYREADARYNECLKTAEANRPLPPDAVNQIDARVQALVTQTRAPAGTLVPLRTAIMTVEPGQRGMVFFEVPADSPPVRTAKRDASLQALAQRYWSINDNLRLSALCLTAQSNTRNQERIGYQGNMDRCYTTNQALGEAQRKVAAYDPRALLNLTPAERQARDQCLAARFDCKLVDGAMARAAAP